MPLLFLGVIAALVWVAVLATRLNRHQEVVEAQARRLDRLSEELAELRAQRRVVAPPVTAAPVTAPPVIAPPALVEARPVIAATPAPIAPSVAERSADDWEAAVGGNWLNRAGVLVFITGVALLIGYSMTHVGPAGRVGLGYVLSLAMLLTGVTLERRDGFRNYAYGLIGGGWAGVYFTTYAMHAVDAAKILDSAVIATAALCAVAAAMVVHSLKYRAQIVTVLAYIVAFATLALTSLAGFALVASVPLAVSLIVVAQRYAWPGLSALGVACTYGIFALRGDLSASHMGGYATLAVYWLLFEAADVIALRRQAAAGTTSAPLFPLNAAGLIGAGVMRIPIGTSEPLANFLAVAGVAYLASAIARAKWLAPSDHDSDDLTSLAFGVHQSAVIVAAGLITWSMGLRFSGARLALTWLVDAELFFIAGLILRDRVVRLTGAAVAVLASLHAAAIGLDHAGATIAWLWSVRTATVAGIGTAVAWYANRELLRWRGLRPLAHEWAFTPAATALCVISAFGEMHGGHPAFAMLMLAVVLAEAGVRVGIEYRSQAYVTGAAGACVLLLWFINPGLFDARPQTVDAWRLLPLSVAFTLFAAWRFASLAERAARVEGTIAAASSQFLAAAFVLVFEWQVLDPQYVGLAWTGTAALVAGVGLIRRVSGLRWQAYPMLLFALVRVMRPLLPPDGVVTPLDVASALTTIAVWFVVVIAVRRALAKGGALAEIEDGVRVAMTVAATAALGLVIFREVRPSMVSLTWGLEGAGLLLVGFVARERLMRLLGLVAFPCVIARLFFYDLAQFEGLARILSFVALGAVLLAVSWVYTRYREKLSKHL